MKEEPGPEDQLTEAQALKWVAIGRARMELIGRMRKALEIGDTLAALRLAREVCGLPAEETAH